jgi:hypothetical protein
MTDSQNARDRLYLALYVRDGIAPTYQGEDRYHWALLEVPSNNNNQATRFHARDHFISVDQTHWLYEEIHVSPRGTPKLLSQTYIGDVVDNEGLFEILRDAPVMQDGRGNCVSWVEVAMQLVWEGGVLEGGRRNSMELLKSLALKAADAEVIRKKNIVRALL